MRLLHLALAAFLVIFPSGFPALAADSDEVRALANEALTEALTLPAGYKRDVVLRAVSRNLRWFGQQDAGVRAARAMTDGGSTELPAAASSSRPRYVPLGEAYPAGNPCDSGLWREASGGEATTPKAREAWARTCLLERDFHWIGLPKVEQVRTVAAMLPSGETKAQVLAMLIRTYRDRETLKFVTMQLQQSGDSLPRPGREGLAGMLRNPAGLYKLGRAEEALAAARSSRAFDPRAELIRLLIEAGDAATAATVFELLTSSPPPDGEDCFDWFGPIGGLQLAYLGNAGSPSSGLGDFLDRLPASPLFRRVCPNGLNAEMEVEYLLAAGRLDPAIARARRDTKLPFLLVDALLQTAHVKLREGRRDTARALMIEAGAALPDFVPADPADPKEDSSKVVLDSGPDLPARRFGERPGDTERRFRVIQMLAATGAPTQADAIARKQPSGAMRAVALSAAVAGRAGIRFDEHAETLSSIQANDL